MDCTEAKFVGAIKNHKMIIRQNDGVFRHITFEEPETMNHHFHLTTWPGYLCISGDMGTYVFTRLQDMFSFFRNSNQGINPGYWHEKMQAEGRERAKKFSKEKFDEAVRDEFRMACRDGVIEPGNRKEVWVDIKREVLNPENEYEASSTTYEFESCGFRFDDFWEHDLMKYTYHFIWCLRAIVWGINMYDQFNATTKMEEKT